MDLLNIFAGIASYSFTITLNLTTAALLTVALIILVTYVIRYYVLAQYSRLPFAQPQAKAMDTHAPTIDLGTETASENVHEKRFLPEDIFANFLSSIKIFNY